MTHVVSDSRQQYINIIHRYTGTYSSSFMSSKSPILNVIKIKPQKVANICNIDDKHKQL
jgi:hypothetical protein